MTTTYENISDLTVTNADGKVMTERDFKERVFRRHGQLDYQKFILTDYWFVRPTVVMLTSFHMEVNGLFDQGDPVETFSELYIKFSDFIVYDWLLREGRDKYTNINANDDDEPGSVDFDKARFRRDDLFNFITKNNTIKLDIERLKRFISGNAVPAELSYNTTSPSKEDAKEFLNNQQTNVNSDNNVFTDVKYPVYKGLDYEMLDKKTFEDMKKYYGMLQKEESKWRRTIPIASKIGLLFYERSLNKPTTRPAFIKKYKLEFDALLKNNTVASIIYDSLPEEYRGGSGTPVTVLDTDVIIKAAVFTGAQAGDRDAMNLISLKKSMKLESITLPSDDILEKMIAYVKQLDIEDDE